MEAKGRVLRGRSDQLPQVLLRAQVRLKFVVFSNKEVVSGLLRAVFPGTVESQTN